MQSYIFFIKKQNIPIFNIKPTNTTKFLNKITKLNKKNIQSFIQKKFFRKKVTHSLMHTEEVLPYA